MRPNPGDDEKMNKLMNNLLIIGICVVIFIWLRALTAPTGHERTRQSDQHVKDDVTDRYDDGLNEMRRDLARARERALRDPSQAVRMESCYCYRNGEEVCPLPMTPDGHPVMVNHVDCTTSRYPLLEPEVPHTGRYAP